MNSKTFEKLTGEKLESYEEEQSKEMLSEEKCEDDFNLKADEARKLAIKKELAMIHKKIKKNIRKLYCIHYLDIDDEEFINDIKKKLIENNYKVEYDGMSVEISW